MICTIVTLAFRRRTKSLPAISRSGSPDDPHRSSEHDPVAFVRELNSKTVSRGYSFQPAHVFPILVLLSALVVQFLFPRLQIFNPRQPAQQVAPPASCPPPASNPFLQDLICPHPPLEQSGTLYNVAPRSMALAEQAKKVAAEFEYTSKDVNKATQAFIKQMSAY